MIPWLVSLTLIFAQLAQAADLCYPKFRDPVDKALRGISQDCKALEKDVPSDCQRAVGTRCQNSYNEAKRIRTEICGALSTDGAFIAASQYSSGVQGQNDAQNANSAMNTDTATVSEEMAKKLEGESAKLGDVIKQNESTIRAEQCVRNAYYPVLANRTKIMNDNLVIVRQQLEALAKKKKKDAAEATAVAAKSDRNSSDLSSLNDSIDADENGKKKWVVPALIAGTAAAALYALYKMKDKGNPGEEVDLSPDGEPTPGPDGGMPSPADKSPLPPYQGDPKDFFEKGGIRVDPAFSDASKRQIAAAISKIPECHRKKLSGSVIRSSPNLKWRDGRGCLPGKNSGMQPPTVLLNETCQTGMSTHAALVVHELMHVLANRGSPTLYSRYRKAFNANPGCGVSRYSHQFYGGKNLNEDFAEAARFVFYPESGQMYSSTCAKNRIQAVREILNSCQ